jgi:hypothetical protein
MVLDFHSHIVVLQNQWIRSFNVPVFRNKETMGRDAFKDTHLFQMLPYSTVYSTVIASNPGTVLQQFLLNRELQELDQF